MMKIFLTCAVVLFTTIAADAGCPPQNLTNVVRIRTYDCAIPAATIRVYLADETWDATRIADGYWEATLTKRIDALKYPIAIQPGQGLSDCCQSAKEEPVSIDSNDCYVEFTVSCDKPEWGFTVSSTPQLTFDYERDHPNGFNNKWACIKTAQVSGTISGFGAADQVHLLLRRNNISVLSYLITPALLQKSTIPLTRHDLEKMIDDDARKNSSVPGTPAAKEAIAKRKSLLPDSITLTKSQ